MGTIDYVAPEQIRGDHVDGRADVYSLGCLLYECLTGRQPFKRGNDAAVLYAHLEDEPPSTGGAADPVIAKALAKIPDDRYQTCAELVEAARAALGVAAPRPSRLLPAVAAVAARRVPSRRSSPSSSSEPEAGRAGPARRAVPHRPEDETRLGSVAVGSDAYRRRGRGRTRLGHIARRRQRLSRRRSTASTRSGSRPGRAGRCRGRGAAPTWPTRVDTAGDGRLGGR